MQVLILRLLSMFLWCPGVLALKSTVSSPMTFAMRFLCSVSSLNEAVHHKSDSSLWAVLSSAAEDAATWRSWCTWVPCTSWWSCCHQLCSFSVAVVGVATGQCSRSCSSPNHPGGIADTVGPQFEDLQHCCLGEWTLLFSFHAPWSTVKRQCHIYVQDTHCTALLLLLLICIWQCFTSSFPWLKLVWTLGVFLWNRSTLETLCSDVSRVREVITVSRYSFCESFRQ